MKDKAVIWTGVIYLSWVVVGIMLIAVRHHRHPHLARFVAYAAGIALVLIALLLLASAIGRRRAMLQTRRPRKA